MEKYVWEIVDEEDGTFTIHRPGSAPASAGSMATAQKKMLRSYRAKTSSWQRHGWTVEDEGGSDTRIEASAQPPDRADATSLLLNLDADLYAAAKCAADAQYITLSAFVRNAIQNAIQDAIEEE